MKYLIAAAGAFYAAAITSLHILYREENSLLTLLFFFFAFVGLEDFLGYLISRLERSLR